MSESFSVKEIEEQLISLGKTLDKFIQPQEDELNGLTPEDLDREKIKKSNEESIKIASSMDNIYVLTSCAARIADETRAARDINIAKATRKQLLLSRLNIIYDKYNYLKKRLDNIKQREQQNA